MKSPNFHPVLFAALALLLPACACPQQRPYPDVKLHLAIPRHGGAATSPAVAWLKPLAGTPPTPFAPRSHYTLLQKNRMFTPHLLVIPMGSTVDFPNADPFFHNVFSLFDGKRFDLGLYEAGASKQVVFSREGVSYIFCNIHPEMSAVVLSLSTPLYAVADAQEAIVLHAIRPGDYRLNIWIEAVPQSLLDHLGRTVHVGSGTVDLGNIEVPAPTQFTHTNKFGGQYNPTKPTY